MGDESGSIDEEYLSLIRTVVESQKALLGENVAMAAAHKAPLEIDANGEITGYYGEGEVALEILIEQYEELIGEQVADNRIQQSLANRQPDHTKLVPKRVRP